MTANVTPATVLSGLRPKRRARIAAMAAPAHSMESAGIVTNGPCSAAGARRQRNVSTGKAADPNVTATSTDDSWEERRDHRATSGAMM